VVRFVFSVEDLARTRFAISPMLELVHSLVALRDPAHAALHLPWLRSLSGRLDGLALERAVALLPPRGFTPDFLTPPPSGPLGSIEDDLAALRATRVAQIRDEIELFASQHPKAEATAARWLATRATRYAGSPTCSRPTGSAPSSRSGRGCARSSTRTSRTARDVSPTADRRRSSRTSPTA
jgi:hypothetical protein